MRKGISHTNGPLWVLAGPGSGKTELLVLRCLKLLLVDEVPPRSIILTTFTEKAARTLQNRLVTRQAMMRAESNSVMDVDVSDVRIGTFHGIANDVMHEFRYLPYQNIRLLDQLEQLMFTYKKAAIAAGQTGIVKKPPSEDFWKRFRFLVGREIEFYPNRWMRESRNRPFR